MKCPACECEVQRAMLEQECLCDKEGRRQVLSEVTLCISCAKCNLTLWTPGEGWRDWSDTALIWDETMQRLEISRPISLRKQPNPDAKLRSTLGKLTKEQLGTLLSLLEKETNNAID